MGGLCRASPTGDHENIRYKYGIALGCVLITWLPSLHTCVVMWISSSARTCSRRRGARGKKVIAAMQ